MAEESSIIELNDCIRNCKYEMELSALDDVNPIIKTSNSRQLLA